MNKQWLRSAVLIVIGICLGSATQAQLLTEVREFDRQDSLRGTLNEMRSCYDVTYYELRLKVDPENRTIEGSNRIDFVATTDFAVLQLDLFEEMKISKIVRSTKEEEEDLKFRREGKAIFVSCGNIKEGSNESLTVHYGGKPIVAKNAPWDGGFTWAKDSMDKHWIGVSCEGIGASLWWPNKDHPTEEPDSMLISCTVPDDLVFVGNGNLREKAKAEEGWMRYDWFVSYPINNYNVTLNIGDYVHFGETFQGKNGELALDYYVLPYNLETAREHFQQVAPMMECFEEMLGPYPFYRDGFALVETPYLGMEHQSAIAYGNQYKTGYAGHDYSRIGLTFDYIIIHEAGHEWWGNSVSCADMADLWIHEGFCTYSEALYVECIHDYETALDYVNAKKPTIRNKKPVVGIYGVNSEGSSDMYSKGMLILNTLRHMLADDTKWMDLMRQINIDYNIEVVSSHELENYIAEKTGLQLDAFWDQYLRNATPPVLEYKFEKKGKKIKVSYRWDAISGFEMPISYAVQGSEEGPQKINPSAEWQTIELGKVDPDLFSFNDRHHYYLLREVQ